MNELFTYLFDENVLKNKLREKWIKLYDFNFIDKEIIGYSHLFIIKQQRVISQ